MRILFATFGSLGDLHPVLAIAAESQRRGHRATIATVAGYQEKIEALGLGFHLLRPELSLSDEELVRRIVDHVRGPELLLRDLLLANVRAMHADLAAAAGDADLLVTSELVYAAPVVSEQLGVPWVSYALAPLSYFSSADPPVPPVAGLGPLLRSCPPALRAVKALARWITRPWWRPLRALRRELGLPPSQDPFIRGKFSPLLDLALFSAVLQARPRDWPPQTMQTGFCFFDEAPAEQSQSARLPAAVEEFLAAGEPPIVFTLGSSAVHAAGGFYAESARAAARLSRRALLLIGRHPPPANLPASVLAWDYLPYAGLFPRTAAVVHSGGIGTTAQALRAGRPMLIMPFAFDQFDNAARVARLGAGRVISRRRYRERTATRELAALLGDSRHAETAVVLGERIRRERGAEAACDALERALR